MLYGQGFWGNVPQLSFVSKNAASSSRVELNANNNQAYNGQMELKKKANQVQSHSVEPVKPPDVGHPDWNKYLAEMMGKVLDIDVVSTIL